MDSPTPDRWRAFAAHASQQAEAAEADGNFTEAARCKDKADFYERQAVTEEWLLSRRAPIILGEAA